MRKVAIGIIGLGTVGKAIVELLQKNKEYIQQKIHCEIFIKKIAVQNLKKERNVNLEGIELSDDISSIINDEEIKVIFEMMGGFDEAATVIKQAYQNKKFVITANKALLAERWNDFRDILYDGKIFFEASVAGGIPIIRTLQESLTANHIFSITGIINGTANYILTQMEQNKCSFQTALSDAQKKGYAESVPDFDVQGIDAAHKAAILANLVYQYSFPFSDIYVEGITNVDEYDIQYANEFDSRIKLLGIINKKENVVDIRVHPALVSKTHMLSSVNGVYNALFIDGDFVGETMLYGQGAGGHPTASSAVADLIYYLQNGCTSYFSKSSASTSDNLYLLPIDKTFNKYFLRFSIIDRIGILNTITAVFNEYNISIHSLKQPIADKNGHTDILIITHTAQENNIQLAIKIIERHDFNRKPCKLIRIVD